MNQDIYISRYSLSQSRVLCLKHRTQEMILGTVFSKLVWLVLFQMHWRGARLLYTLWSLQARFVKVVTPHSAHCISSWEDHFCLSACCQWQLSCYKSRVRWLEQRMYGPAFCVLFWGDQGLPQEEPHEKDTRVGRRQEVGVGRMLGSLHCHDSCWRDRAEQSEQFRIG